MTSRFSAQELRAQVHAAVDPTGEQTTLLDAVAGTDKQTWIQILGAEAGRQWDELSAHRSSYTALLTSMQDALELLVPSGWAPFQMDSAAVTAAIEHARSGDVVGADELLARQWEGEGAWRTKRVCDRVRTMGAGARQHDYEALFRERARLLMKAKQHHEAGSYEASIPILHGQMEGLVIDVAGGAKFFTKRQDRADLSDPTQLITIEACLPVLQGLFSEGVTGTQTDGSLSRHGVAHGRELAYDTKENSAKCWSVLDAIVEWALPLARAEAERRLSDEQTRRAGSQDVDEEGRRLDDREFRETRDVLTLLGYSAIGHRRNAGSFRTDLIGGVYTTADLVKRGLPVDHQVRMDISKDGDIAWFWRRTVTGWVLAYAVALDDGNMVDWYFSGPNEPSGPPGADWSWSERSVRATDWS